MGQILVDRVLHGAGPVYGGGNERARDAGTHVGGGFNALVAARRMGAEAVSLSPIGTGPHASLITDALAREGIVDAGPRVEGVDNGFCVALIDSRAERTFISTKGAETMTPTSAWADFVRMMNPGDVLYIDGYLMDHPANREAAEAALRVLPEGVHVVLDVSPVIGIPDGLPPTSLISMSTSEAASLWRHADRKAINVRSWLPDEDASIAMATLLRRDVVVRAGKDGAYFTRYANSAELTSTHVPPLSVEVIDTNGAGDAHTGVLAACLAEGMSMERGLLLANCAGALASTAVGPATCPPRAQIEAAADTPTEQED
jgi:ADP-ribosylglycohydrolase family protein